ncbi:MAG: phosphatidylserine decarboxylase [Bryobacterales bacterium]|nr:phosphatidylserine decarboxylase [Bryobacterales bacterium]
MVADGIYYAFGLAAGGALAGWLTNQWFASPLYILAVFCLWFFRDPEREIPYGPVAVSPADGKVVVVKPENGGTRISIFLNVFDVHVNRTPIAGSVTAVDYRKGEFLVASKDEASSRNEQNTLTVEGNGSRVVFSQIAGLIARRIVCFKKPGDKVAMGERIGLIKFGSRVDVAFGPEWDIVVTPGMRVSAGSSVIARRRAPVGAKEAPKAQHGEARL